MNRLPVEMLYEISLWVEDDDILLVRLIARRFNNLIKNVHQKWYASLKVSTFDDYVEKPLPRPITISRKSFSFHVGAGGYWNLLKWPRLFKKVNNCICLGNQICQGAARNGHVEILKWVSGLYQGRYFDRCYTKKLLNDTVFSQAILGGHVEVFEYLKGYEYKDYDHLWEKAAMSGNIVIAQWLLERYPKTDSSLYLFAANEGHLEFIQWLYDYLKVPMASKIYEVAISKRHYDIVKWVCTLADAPLFRSADCEIACRNGDLEFIQWLLDRDAPISVFCLKETIKVGNFDVLKFLHARSVQFNWIGTPDWTGTGDWSNQHLCDAAVRCEQLEILKWLRLQGHPWDAGTFALAASTGNLEILEWLRSQGCPWDGKACVEAIRSQKFGILKWLRSRGCPWDSKIYDQLAKQGNLAILKKIRAHILGEPPPWSSRIIVEAASYGDLKLIKWVLEKPHVGPNPAYCYFDKEAISMAKSFGYLDIYEYLIKRFRVIKQPE